MGIVYPAEGNGARELFLGKSIKRYFYTYFIHEFKKTRSVLHNRTFRPQAGEAGAYRFICFSKAAPGFRKSL
jgi:hypothetical protein